MGYINKIVLQNGQTSQRALIEPTLWGVCETEGDVQRKIVSINDFALVIGVQVTIRFTNANSAVSPTLNINNTGHIGIIYKREPISPNFLNSGINYSFIYNGTNYELVSVAAQWDMPQTVYVDLATASTSTTLQGGSANAEVLGIDGILSTANGGTGVSSHVANRFVWSTNTTTLQATGSHYVDAEKIAVNYTSEPDANFFVQGTTIISSDLQNDGTSGEFFKVGNMITRYLSIGANGLQAFAINQNEVSNGRLDLQPEGGTLYISNSQATLTAYLYGTYNFETINGFNYIGIRSSAYNEYVPIWFSAGEINSQTSENTANTGIPVYDTSLTYNANTHYIRINNNGGIISGNSNLNITASSDIILTAGNNHGIIFKENTTTVGSFNASGAFVIGNPATATVTNAASLFFVDGASYFNGNVTFAGDLIPSNSNRMLGTSNHRWGGLILGTANTYGDAYTPIYWNNGVPSTVATIQKNSFSFASGENVKELSNSAYTTNTIVITIVVTNGGENLNSPIATQASNGKLTLSTDDVSGTVSGYVITARGVDLAQGV